ncbi:hypothetical protein CERSUDRAFT_115333 [Gelatoporia subvermispora B]|uniref:Uncharacterized protein n=1 Tax=Ceriporiopsis subvermispora (strain B) TaxID=914234 RepID=M2QW72_CERS8|nr:hypothetical protein CERSUDRAFT_115333 [Gelatoporia subvermispora B]
MTLRVLGEYMTSKADICCAIGSSALRLQSGRAITFLSIAQLGWSLRGVLTAVKNHSGDKPYRSYETTHLDRITVLTIGCPTCMRVELP